MSAQRITTSKTKLQYWQEIRDLDALAKAIAARDGIAVVEAYPKAVEEKNR